VERAAGQLPGYPTFAAPQHHRKRTGASSIQPRGGGPECRPAALLDWAGCAAPFSPVTSGSWRAFPEPQGACVWLQGHSQFLSPGLESNATAFAAGFRLPKRWSCRHALRDIQNLRPAADAVGRLPGPFCLLAEALGRTQATKTHRTAEAVARKTPSPLLSQRRGAAESAAPTFSAGEWPPSPCFLRARESRSATSPFGGAKAPGPHGVPPKTAIEDACTSFYS